VIHTPGHASNHLCYLLEEEKTLFTGDHVMQASTVVINPPDGDMATYIASLRQVAALDLDWLAPGPRLPHGRAARCDRGDRRASVAAGVEGRRRPRELGPASAETLLARVYAGRPSHLHGVAMRSLTAHC
jgi:glyoxylase-like metal-dependent hydrolase (beta-lactamase superfamily II)